MASRLENSSTDTTMLKLVSGLSLEERKNFLEKLKDHSTMSPLALYESGEETETKEKNDTQYMQLPWYYRLWYFIISLFKSSPVDTIYAESKVSKLAREIDLGWPGMYDYQRNILLPDFYQVLADLKDAARFFFTALDASVNRDRGNFYAFLGSLEMNEVHLSLLPNTEPEKILEMAAALKEGASHVDVSEIEARKAAIGNMENALAHITEEQRNIMYFNARSLNCMKELSSFLFDRVLLAFGADGGGHACSVNVVRELLADLNNILFSMKAPPSLPLLESLFIFRLQERKKESGFNMDREIQGLLSKAEDAINAIRAFNQRVPLTRIIRCATRDFQYVPRQISGGEDWFHIYREHWKQQTEYLINDFFKKRKQREVFDSFRQFLKGTNLKVLQNVVSDTNPNGVPVPEAFTLAFLQTFHSAVFLEDANVYLRPVLLDGEFIKRENRAEFTSAYNDIMKIADDVKKFDADLSPDGDYGKRYIQAKDDMTSLAIKRRKIQIALSEASTDAAAMVSRSRDAFRMMINVLSGILNTEPGAKYDKLINLEKIAGKNTEAFRKGIAESISQFNQALQILKDIEAMGNLW